MVAALDRPEACKNRAMIVNSFTSKLGDIVQEFERQTDSKWTVETTSFDKMREIEKSQYDDGKPTAPLLTLRRIWAEGGTQYEKTDNESLGNPETDTLQNQVALAIKRQKS